MATQAQDLAAVATMVDQITKRYPAFAPLLKIPDVAKLLIEASQPGQAWTSDQFMAKLQGTDWWRNTSQPARQWTITQLTQPGEAANQQAQTAQQIHAAAAQEGIVLSPDDLSTLVDNALKNAWTAGQMQQNIAAQAHFKALKPGTIDSTMGNLQSIAADYGIPVSDQTSFQWAKKIAEGTATQDGFTSFSQQHAKALYPHLKDQLDQGFTVRQIADPYMQVAAQSGVLVNPAEVNLADPKWSRALQSRDKDGKITGPMTLADWQRTIMSDPTYGWDHTTQARDAATNIIQSLGHAFGVSA